MVATEGPIREKLRANCRPFLATDEQIQQAFVAHRFGGPWIWLLGIAAGVAFAPVGAGSRSTLLIVRIVCAMLLGAYLAGVGERLICVTDHRVLVFSARRLRAFEPREQLATLPRTSPFETSWRNYPRLPWGLTRATGQALYIEARFRIEVQAADAAANRTFTGAGGRGRLVGAPVASASGAPKPPNSEVGWHPDPDGGAFDRWFNGDRWTVRVRKRPHPDH